MRRLFQLSTALFWLAVAAFWSASTWLPEPPPSSAQAPAPTTAQASDRSFTLADVARHAGEGDCWMAIGGQVYDISSYVPQHPADPAILLPWCGKEASDAYKTKTKGRPHSPYADQMLPRYRIGVLKAAK